MSILKKARSKQQQRKNDEGKEPNHYHANPLPSRTYLTGVIPKNTQGYRTAFVPPPAIEGRSNPDHGNQKRKKRKEPLVPKDEKAFDVREDVRRGRPGRRSAIPGAKRSRKLTVNVSGLEYVAIVQAAEDQGVSTSTLLRLAVFDGYGVPRPHPEKVPTVAQKRREGRKRRQNKRSKAENGE